MRVMTRLAVAVALLMTSGLLCSCTQGGPVQSANNPAAAQKIDDFAKKDRGEQAPGGLDYINSQRPAPK